jgi:acetyltransferase-like isoleucine patch superfamily enzyme
VKEAKTRFLSLYARHFLFPHFASVGEGMNVADPWNVEVFGPNIEVGRYVSVMATRDGKVRITMWPEKMGTGLLRIGDYTIINPGVRISAAREVTIGANTMIASNVYITDADWHGTHDRVYSFGGVAPVRIERNVWLGDGAVVCKGVTIGENSIVGAGSIVVKDIPSNVVAAGNPARPVKEIDPDGDFKTREQIWADPRAFIDTAKRLEREILKHNTLAGWLRSRLFPKRGD